jgi:2-polyprenyl-3-methyl-5-hydroxy-6-metoxy-1,4-benzoquinol methylase
MVSLNNPAYCPVCTAPALRFVFDCIDHSISKETFRIWECNACTHRFTFPVPGEVEIGRYYDAEHYISHSDTSKGIIAKLYKIARKFTLSEKRRFVQRQTGLASGILLEVGTGTGAFLNEMETSGWQTTGLEPDFHARQRAMNLYKLPVHEPSQLFELTPDSFDAITLWHVLEHVFDLPGYLRQFGKLLKSSGLLFIAVPNYTSYDGKHYEANWAAYDVPRHLHHFSPASMQSLAGQYGFEIVKRKAMWLDAFYIALLSEQYRFGRNRFIHAFFHGMISVINAFVNRTRCSSVIYVLKKEAAK